MREECSSFAEKLTGLFSHLVEETFNARLPRELDELEVTLSQLQALTLVAERNVCSIGALAEGLGVSHPAAVKLAEKLARKELVSREVGANDHRQTVLRIRPQGRELVQRVREERMERLERVLSQMPAAERQALIRGLQGFVNAALPERDALDALCTSCQAVQPTDCNEFRILTAERPVTLTG